MCYAYSKFYKELRDLYKNVDLSYVNNGEFIAELSNTYVTALRKAEESRIIEAKADNVVEEYEVYEESYYEYTKLYKLIVDNLSIMEKLQQKETLQHKGAATGGQGKEKKQYDKALPKLSDLLDKWAAL